MEVLNVKQNQIYTEGLMEILDAFENNRNLKLKQLDISSNKVNDDGGKMLASALAKV